MTNFMPAKQASKSEKNMLVLYKIKYVPMHTIRVITRLAQKARRTDRASALSQLRLEYALASISCEHCRSSRNNPHYPPRHIIYYYDIIRNF